MRSAQAAGAGFSPLDDELALDPGAFSPFLSEAIARLGTHLPFERVPAELAFFTGVAIGEETARRHTEAAGAALVGLEQAELAELARACPPPPAGPPVQLVSVDGAMVPLVHKEWAEVKTLAIGTVVASTTPDAESAVHTHELSYCCRLTDAEQFRDLATLETHRRGTRRAGTVCAVADGAEWIQHFIDWRCPQAVRILDFTHAKDHVRDAALAVFGAGTAAGSAWLGTQLHELKHGDPDRVLAALRALPVASATDPTTAEATVTEVLGYLEPRRPQLTYAEFQAQGYPIGSGSVESANKLVVEARLKGAGMHWARPNVNPMVAMRAMACSGRWAERWPLLGAERRQQQARARQERCQARHPKTEPGVPPVAKPPRPPKPTPLSRLPKKGTMADGRPTTDHPFKRAPAVAHRPHHSDLAKV